MEIEGVFLNGTVGAGKTMTGEALHRILADDGISNAMIDLDQLRRSWPAPPTDRFNHELELKNLQSIAANYRVAGIRRFVLAGVLEDPAEVARYRIALGGARLTVIWLDPPLDTVQERLRNRHEPDSAELSWHLHRSGELHGILTKAQLEAHTLPIVGQGSNEVAREVRALVGW